MALERLLECPWCYSKYEEISGWIFPVGDPAGHKCTHPWHQKVGYDPDKLILTDADRVWFKEMAISDR
jgi:hypothetical protein